MLLTMDSGKAVMIPRLTGTKHTPGWQATLARAINSVDELLHLLELDAAAINVHPLDRDFPLKVPRGFVQRMKKGDIHDPLLRQVLPVRDEIGQLDGYTSDPLDEIKAMPRPGLLHKYHGRALLTVTGACAVHCRYCFRRHFPYAAANPAAQDWEEALHYLRNHPEISEIILSGGDPLALPDERLQALVNQLADLPHVDTLRIHTRLPVVLPERIDEALLAWITHHRLKTVMVVHCNHPNEIDSAVVGAIGKLTRVGVTLLNQSVLLRGINDSVETLIQLSKKLFAAGILPYYLHQLDRVQGAAHFEVDDERASQLMDAIHTALPGYLVPRLVTEAPGAPGKTPAWPKG